MENQLFNLLWTTDVHLLGPQLQLPKTKYLLTITSLDPLPCCRQQALAPVLTPSVLIPCRTCSSQCCKYSSDMSCANPSSTKSLSSLLRRPRMRSSACRHSCAIVAPVSSAGMPCTARMPVQRILTFSRRPTLVVMVSLRHSPAACGRLVGGQLAGCSEAPGTFAQFPAMPPIPLNNKTPKVCVTGRSSSSSMPLGCRPACPARRCRALQSTSCSGGVSGRASRCCVKNLHSSMGIKSVAEATSIMHWTRM